MWISAGNLFKFCCRAYTLPCCCIRLTSNSNLFLILIVEHDTDTRVNLKDIHMMTDKSNCSQLQVYCDKISYSWWDLLCHHNIWLSCSSGGRSQGRVHSGLRSISSPATPFDFNLSIPKYSLWIHKVECHTSTVVFCRLMVWLSMEGWRKNQRESESENLVLTFLLDLMSIWLRFGLFQQIQIRTERLPNLAERVAYQR